MATTVSVEWSKSPVKGSVEVRNGELDRLSLVKGDTGHISGNEFGFLHGEHVRLDIAVSGARVTHAASPTVVTIRSDRGSFSFLLRDVNSDYPIFIPDFGVVVTESTDPRTYESIAEHIRRKGLQTSLQRIETEPEESFGESASVTRKQHCPTWLGLSRDIRIFEIDYNGFDHTVKSRLHSHDIPVSDTDATFLAYSYFVGRGTACCDDFTRRLEDGVWPILLGELVDDDVTYSITNFVVPEKTPLTKESLRGTHFLVADNYGRGRMFTEEQQAQFESLHTQEVKRDEETVLFLQVKAVNTASVPRYAWFKAPRGRWRTPSSFDTESGFGLLEGRGVFCVCLLNGEKMPKEEVAILLKPGETAVWELRFPHEPVTPERAAALAQQDFDARHAECREFWKAKLASAAQISVPDKHINEMIQAGLLHLDLIHYGLEPDCPVAPMIGVYSPIGSESSPIVQFVDAMGWHDLAERALQYFLEKQHEDGFIQNFGGYMLETGAALWSLGEHYRYTKDRDWANKSLPKLLKSCDYLIEWHKRNLKEELKGKGYGMLDGKVADPEDHFRLFMLNGYAYLGLSRIAEILADVQNPEGQRISEAAEELKNDIRTALFEGLERSPVVPVGDGTWLPTAPPWAEADGPMALLTDDKPWFSHGTVGCRDSMLGPLYLVFQEVIGLQEQAADWLLKYNADLFHMRNAAFSQPYYSPHALVHLRLGQVKPFLKAYFNSFMGLIDRETYTFWEHVFHVSPHKTHEEGWFLLQTRWMLWLEDGDALKLLPGIPRAWLENGKKIELKDVATYFGHISLSVESHLEQGFIKAEVSCDSDRKPIRIGIRLPHPKYAEAVSAEGGAYDADTETVWVEPTDGRAEAMLYY